MKLYIYGTPPIPLCLSGYSWRNNKDFEPRGVLVLLDRKPKNYPIYDKPINFWKILSRSMPSKEELETTFPVVLENCLNDPIEFCDLIWGGYELKLPSSIEFIYEEVSEKLSYKDNDNVYILYKRDERLSDRFYCDWEKDDWDKIDIVAFVKYKPANPFLEFCSEKVIGIYESEMNNYKDYYPVLLSKSMYDPTVKYINRDGTVGFRGTGYIDIPKDTSDSPCKTIGDYMAEEWKNTPWLVKVLDKIIDWL
jgi:hypothetical protein